MFGGSISYLSHQILSSSSIAAAWLGLFAHRYFYLATNTKRAFYPIQPIRAEYADLWTNQRPVSRAFYPIQTIVRGKLIAFDVFVEIAVFRFAFTGQSARREKWRGLMDNLGKYLSHIIWLQKHLNFYNVYNFGQHIYSTLMNLLQDSRIHILRKCKYFLFCKWTHKN